VDPKRIIEQGYDQIAPRHDEWSSGVGVENRRWFLDEMLQRLPPRVEVFELGCGSGPDAATLADGGSYTGVDLSEGQLALARERFPSGTFVHGDLTQVSFQDEAFDAVVAFFVFNHVPRAEQGPTFARVFRWLRRGGHFMLSLGASDSEDGVQEDWLGVPMFFAGFEPDANERALRHVGFELALSETRSQVEEGEEATFHWVIARKPAKP
jgi:ubiquinone/menaquinone biosynthesis C-methylase UbiE